MGGRVGGLKALFVLKNSKGYWDVKHPNDKNGWGA